MVSASPAAENQSLLRRLRLTPDSERARIRVLANEKAPAPVPRFITGKFAEHLGANIYNGMDAQILRNPTFADFPFGTGQTTPDGIIKFHADEQTIEQEIRRQSARFGWPEGELDDLIGARSDGLACWWTREGSRADVVVSPDTGPFGGRAQRIAVRRAGAGIAQWAFLPLHRVRRYEYELFARSPDSLSLNVSLWRAGTTNGVASGKPVVLTPNWRKLTGTLELGIDAPPDAAYRIVLAGLEEGQVVMQRLMLRPADHIHGADPDVIRLLRESRLPLLRWPGGNFVSGYHWEDGVGPLERRPTRPNYAWGGVEPNLFGTDEFIAFCRSVGCEPMICVNAGDGTPEEAARWIEYCNRPVTSPMGARRAANGHPSPYRVKHWEVGNELWGKWQVHWTTAEGYVDRYAAFAKAMAEADPAIELYACGAPVFSGKAWNQTLIKGAAPILKTTTDHPLIGGQVHSSSEPLDVYRDFMAVPEVLERRWAELERAMIDAGVRTPRLAVTELQMFARIRRDATTSDSIRLTQRNLVSPGTLAEGLYDVLIYHAALRLAPFVTMVTHSATVNHGGGLRKERERVYPNPCHYAQSMFAAFADATPVAIELSTGTQRAPLVLPGLKSAASNVAFGAIDAFAAIDREGSLLLSLVNRRVEGPVLVMAELADFDADEFAARRTLAGNVPWEINSLATPDLIAPKDSQIELKAGRFEVELPRFSFTQITIPARAAAKISEPRGAVLFHDDFHGPLREGWRWVRENRPAWRTTDDGLEIRIEPGNMWGPQNNAKNVLVRELPKNQHDALEVSVIASNRPTHQYEQVDLVWYYDDSHMVKIGLELVDGKLSIVMGREERDRTRTIAIIPADFFTVELRLLVKGDQIRGQFREAGTVAWRDAGKCDLPVHGAPHAALQCYQGPPDAERWARLTHFNIRAAAD